MCILRRGLEEHTWICLAVGKPEVPSGTRVAAPAAALISELWRISVEMIMGIGGDDRAMLSRYSNARVEAKSARCRTKIQTRPTRREVNLPGFSTALNVQTPNRPMSPIKIRYMATM